MKSETDERHGFRPLFTKGFPLAATDERQVVRRIANARHFSIDDCNWCVLVIGVWPVAKQVLRRQVPVQNTTAIVGRSLRRDPLANLIGQRELRKQSFIEFS